MTSRIRRQTIEEIQASPGIEETLKGHLDAVPD
jgi:hypothetical protein